MNKAFGRLGVVVASATAALVTGIAQSGPALADTHRFFGTNADPYGDYAFAGYDFSVGTGNLCPPVSGAGDWTADVFFSQHDDAPAYLRSLVVAPDGSWGGAVRIPDTAALGPAGLTAVCFDAEHHVPSTTDVEYEPLSIEIVPVHTFAVDHAAVSPGTPVRVTSIEPCPAAAGAVDWYYVVGARDPETGAFYGTPPIGAPDAAGNWSTTIGMTGASPSAQVQIAAGCGDNDPIAGSTHLDYYLPMTITALPAPNVTLSTKVLAFGHQRLRTTSSGRTVTVTNPSSGTLTFGQATISGASRTDFRILTDTCSHLTLEPGGYCRTTVTFRPTVNANRSAALAFTDNAPASPQLVTLTGRGCTFLLGGLCV